MVLVGNAALIALLISTLLLFTLLFINVKVKKKKQINWCFIAIIICLLICCNLNMYLLSFYLRIYHLKNPPWLSFWKFVECR